MFNNVVSAGKNCEKYKSLLASLRHRSGVDSNSLI